MLILPTNIKCGYFDGSCFHGNPWSPKRKVSQYEIEFYLEDAFETYIDDKPYKIKKDHVLIAKPGSIRYSRLPFKTKFLKLSLDEELAGKIQHLPQYFSTSHSGEILHTLDDIILLHEHDNTILLYSKILAFLNLIILDGETYTGNDYNTVSKAMRFIESHYGEKIKLSDIAENVNLSNVYFHNIFTTSVGKTPHQYLTDCRVENAKKLLWDTAVCLWEVAERCGFCNQQHFNKIFKKKTGMTPREYRSSFQQKYLS